MKVKAVAWDETEGAFVALLTDEAIQNYLAMEWPVVRWNAEKQIFEQPDDLKGGWKEVVALN